MVQVPWKKLACVHYFGTTASSQPVPWNAKYVTVYNGFKCTKKWATCAK